MPWAARPLTQNLYCLPNFVGAQVWTLLFVHCLFRLRLERYQPFKTERVESLLCKGDFQMRQKH